MNFAKNVGLFFLAPFIGLGYVIALPFVGLFYFVRLSVERSAQEVSTALVPDKLVTK